ncbi:MAG: hypothetical protein ACUVTM_02540 [Candidatus Bathyarchaeia archaeon]
MRGWRLIGLILVASGIASLILNILLVVRLMLILIPNMQVATCSELTIFYYAAAPQTIILTVAFITFFITGIYLLKAYSESATPRLSHLGRGSEHTDADSIIHGGAEERLMKVKREILEAMDRLNELDRSNPQ